MVAFVQRVKNGDFDEISRWPAVGSIITLPCRARHSFLKQI